VFGLEEGLALGLYAFAGWDMTCLYLNLKYVSSTDGLSQKGVDENSWKGGAVEKCAG